MVAWPASEVGLVGFHILVPTAHLLHTYTTLVAAGGLHDAGFRAYDTLACEQVPVLVYYLYQHSSYLPLPLPKTPAYTNDGRQPWLPAIRPLYELRWLPTIVTLTVNLPLPLPNC